MQYKLIHDLNIHAVNMKLMGKPKIKTVISVSQMCPELDLFF